VILTIYEAQITLIRKVAYKVPTGLILKQFNCIIKIIIVVL